MWDHKPDDDDDDDDDAGAPGGGGLFLVFLSSLLFPGRQGRRLSHKWVSAGVTTVGPRGRYGHREGNVGNKLPLVVPLVQWKKKKYIYIYIQ